jgi:hypothetical protein
MLTSVQPGLWRPIVGIDAFDLREHEIDITPWLGVLSDGNEHTFEIKVAGINDNGGTTGSVTETVRNSWYVTGKIFIWLDTPSSITTGSAPIVVLPPPLIDLSQTLTQNATGANQTLEYSTVVTRALSVSSIIRTENGTNSAKWSQSLSYSNHASYTNQGSTQVTTFLTTGLDTSTGDHSYSSSYTYPLFANATVNVHSSGNFSIDAIFSHGLDFEVSGKSIYPSSGLASSSSYIHTLQNGTAHYFSSPSTKTGFSFGSTSQEFSFGATVAGRSDATELYYRNVEAVNGSVVRDKEIIGGLRITDFASKVAGGGMGEAEMIGGWDSPKARIGRGPGGNKIGNASNGCGD